MHRSLQAGLASILSLWVAACGGGGGGGAPSGITSAGGAVDTPTLSATQQAYEDNTLSANGGSYTLSVTSSQQFGQPLKLAIATYSKIEIASSPAGVADGVPTVYTKFQVLKAPSGGQLDQDDPRSGVTWVANGNLHFLPSAASMRVIYSGEDVHQVTTMPGTQVELYRDRLTSITKVPLVGTYAQAPAEFLAILGPVANYTNPATLFAPGAAYYRRIGHRVGDALFLYDHDNDWNTHPQSATPAAAGTIEQYAASQPGRLEFGRGAIRTVKGLRCWVNDTSGRANGPSIPASGGGVAPAYGAYCEFGGNVYRGLFTPDGAAFGTIYEISQRFPFSMRLNKAAMDSLKAMIQ